MREFHRSKNARKASALKDTNDIAVVKTTTGKIVQLSDGTYWVYNIFLRILILVLYIIVY